MKDDNMITTCGWFGYDLPMQERFRLIKRVGFDGVTLWWSDEFGNIDHRNTPFMARRSGLYVENIHAPFAGFCYDSGHHNCRTPNVDILSRYGSRLKALHLHDNDGIDDQHCLPFDGTVDWPAIMSKISHGGYAGAVSLEAVNMGYEYLLPEEFLYHAFIRAKKLESML